jgi:hypothetical protein
VALPFEAPGSDLLLHGLSHTTIGAGAFHIRVRDGIEWFHSAMAARETFGAARFLAPARMGTWDVTGLGNEPDVYRGFRLRVSRESFAHRFGDRGLPEATRSYMVKPHGSLVSVS